MTLLDETIDVLHALGHTVDQVEWVGLAQRKWVDKAEVYVAGPAVWWTWGEFRDAAQCAYDGGYGPVYVPRNLVVVGIGWWLERHEYDGSENWEYKAPPVKGDRMPAPDNLCDWPENY